MVKVVNVNPDALRKAADGINGVIDGLNGGFMDSYTSQLGRGFSDLTLSGEQMSRSDAKDGMDNFTERWEWGTRALITEAAQISNGLKLGASMFERQASYFNNAAKDMVNDLAGDPSLQKESTYDENGNLIALGTDDMGWGDMISYNVNQLTNPDWSAQSFVDVLPSVQNSWQDIQANAGQAVTNLAVPGAMSNSMAQGFSEDIEGYIQPRPTAPAPIPDVSVA